VDNYHHNPKALLNNKLLSKSLSLKVIHTIIIILNHRTHHIHANTWLRHIIMRSIRKNIKSIRSSVRVQNMEKAFFTANSWQWCKPRCIAITITCFYTSKICLMNNKTLNKKPTTIDTSKLQKVWSISSVQCFQHNTLGFLHLHQFMQGNKLKFNLPNF